MANLRNSGCRKAACPTASTGASATKPRTVSPGKNVSNDTHTIPHLRNRPSLLHHQHNQRLASCIHETSTTTPIRRRPAGFALVERTGGWLRLGRSSVGLVCRQALVLGLSSLNSKGPGFSRSRLPSGTWQQVSAIPRSRSASGTYWPVTIPAMRLGGAGERAKLAAIGNYWRSYRFNRFYRSRRVFGK